MIFCHPNFPYHNRPGANQTCRSDVASKLRGRRRGSAQLSQLATQKGRQKQLVRLAGAVCLGGNWMDKWWT